MSRYSGKCDLYDHIYVIGTNGDERDEKELFDVFKKRTNGVIYQSKKIVVTLSNQDEVAKNTRGGLRIEEVVDVVPDKRTKDGTREKTSYRYIYYGKEFNNLEDLNNYGVYIAKEIKFNDILDLIPYYPYTIAVCASDEEKETIYLSPKSHIDELEEMLFPSNSAEYYRRELQEHYIDVVNKYFSSTNH